MKRLAPLLGLGALLALPGQALAAGDFDPMEEFLVEPYVSIELGPVDIGPSKAVIYLVLAAIITVLLSLWITRGGLKREPGRFQAVVEMMYGFADSGIARSTLPKSYFSTWFPFIATLFVFIWVLNIISFIPLPIDTHNKIGPIPGPALYAATSNLSVTLTLTIISLGVAHYLGVKAQGPVGYVRSWVPDAPGALKPVLAVLETLSQVLRVVSLSVRLFANMLAGHALIVLCAAFAVVVGNYLGLLLMPMAIVFYVFEVVLVASLQAYIFALLTGIYIAGAVEAHH